jgi:hypothetical protein
MGCCCGRKETHAEKAASRFREYTIGLGFGFLESIIALGLAAAVISKNPPNASMIWHLILVHTMTAPHTFEPITCADG